MQAKYLRKLGWDIPDLGTGVAKRPIADFERLAKGCDLIVTQRSDGMDMMALVRALGELNHCPVVYEYDDNIFDVSVNSPVYPLVHPGSELMLTYETQLEGANALTVSTEGLKQAYAGYVKDIHVLPNYQDLDAWKGISRPKPESALVIGWSGGQSHYDDLRMIMPAMKRILSKHNKVVFRIHGMQADFIPIHPRIQVRKDWAHWSEYQRKLAELNFDIGIIPVVDRPFNVGKSNIKWQEYSMLGIPTVASRVGEYKQIEHEETGLLVNSLDEWQFRLEWLINDANERKRLGNNAKQKIISDYTIDKKIGKWDEAYRSIIK